MRSSLKRLQRQLVKDAVLSHKVRDDEIWRSDKDGRHYRIEEETGKITAGFGGVLNGQTVSGKGSNGFRKQVDYTKSEKEALHEYTTSMYSGVNTLLRNGEIDRWPDAKKLVDQIDSAMDKSVVPNGQEYIRGASTRELAGLFGHSNSWYEDPENLKSLEGQTGTFKSYVSTSKGDKVSEAHKQGGVVWHFETEGDVHGIDMEPFASSEKREIERETLFNRGTDVGVMRVEFKTDADGYVDGDIEIWANLRSHETTN